MDSGIRRKKLLDKKSELSGDSSADPRESGKTPVFSVSVALFAKNRAEGSAKMLTLCRFTKKVKFPLYFCLDSVYNIPKLPKQEDWICALR